jgi:hypothetical protein
LAENLGTIIVGDEVERLAIWSEPRIVGHPVERKRQYFRCAAGCRRDGNVLCRVLEELGVELRRVRDPLAVRRPGGRGVIARIGRDLRQVRPFV